MQDGSNSTLTPDYTPPMSVNKAIAARFDRMSQMMEVLGEDRFRVNAYAKAARTIEELTDDLASLADDKKSLVALEGIGAKTADKIIQFVQTGEIEEYNALAERFPSGLLELLGLSGVGPKTVRLIWQEGGVESMDDLKKAIDDGSILELPRMGKKTVDNLKSAIENARQRSGRLHMGVAQHLADQLVETMGAVTGVTEVAFAGSLRRGKETIGDLDILVATDEPETAIEAFRTMDRVESVLAAGGTKCSVLIPTKNPDERLSDDEPLPTVQVDLRVVPASSWGAAIMYFTGSKEHNIKMRERALKKGLTLNEYGLYPEDDEDTPPQSRGIAAVASVTEADIYDALDLPTIPPELREDRGELAAPPPEGLITLDDIRAELHAHTKASDGRLTIEELATAARDRGFHTIAVTDHSKSAIAGNGLSIDRMKAHIDAVREANEAVEGITILIGTEVDILIDGSLDYDDDLLAQLDIVVASPHVSFNQPTEVATERLVRAIRHPLVDVLGHPTGRMIRRRGGLTPDFNALIQAAVETDTALEINSHWMRLDLRDTHVRAAVEGGANLSINCDVHRRGDFDNLRFGVATGRRGWLTAERCVNTWDHDRLHTWLKRNRA